MNHRPIRAVARSLGCLAAMLAAVCPFAAAFAESPLPFTPEFAAEVESRFFEAGAASEEKVSRYRSLLARRRAEVVAVFASEQRALGRKSGNAQQRAEARKPVRVYDLLLGTAEQFGWLDALLAEPDPVAARRLAGNILELDYALLLEGDKPFTWKLPEHLAAIGGLPWTVPSATRADRVQLEATNLYDPDTERFYEAEDLARLIEQGVDISELGPAPNSSFWRDRGAIAEIDVRESFYRGGHPNLAGLHYPFPESGGDLDSIKKSQTKPKFEIEVAIDGHPYNYKIKVGGEIHSEPVTGAVLSMLGFNADVTRHVKNFRMDLGDMTVEELRNEWRSYFEFKRVHLSYRFDDYFDYGEDERGRFLILKEATLTAKPDEITRVGPWPWGANGNEGVREARALSIISVWLANTDMKEAENNKLLLRESPDGEPEIFHLQHDLGHAFGRVMAEQLNAYPWKLVGKTLGGKIHFNYHSTWLPSVRGRATYADARWAVRLIAQLTREQIHDAVELGSWPEPVARLLVEKMIHRRNQLVEAFGLVGTQTPSGTIELLPVDRDLTTEDGEVAAGALVDGIFEGSTQQYDNYWEEFLGPVWEEVVDGATGVFQKTIGLVPALIFDKDSVGLPKYVLLELLITLKREVEENPRPTNESDYYLVRDTFLLGVRVGGGVIGTGSAAVYRSYTLVQPAGTKREAHRANGTILNVLLPFHVWKDRLPEEYVLLRESYVDGRISAITESLGGSVPPVGARGSLSRVVLSRDVLARQGGTLRAWKDRSHHTERELEAFANLVFVRIPFLFDQVRRGRLEGRSFEIPIEAVEGDLEWSDALTRLVREGDFSGIEKLTPAVPVTAKFRDGDRWLRIPAFFGRSWQNRSDDVTVKRPDRPDEVAESIQQYRTGTSGHWTFLDNGEAFGHTVRTISRAIGSDGKYEAPAIESSYFQRDLNTYDAELGDAYLGFINGIAGRRERLIDFTPALHSENDRWGDLEVDVRVGYSPKAVQRLRKLDATRFWRELAVSLALEEATLERHRELLRVGGKAKQMRRRRVPARERAAIWHANRVLREIEESRELRSVDAWMKSVADALHAASYRRSGWYDPAVLGALHRILGNKQVSIDVSIAPPPWVENRLVGSRPLRARTHRTSHRLPHDPIDFDPQCTAALFEMLDTFPTADGSEVHWLPAAANSGAPCDGTRGDFAQ